MVHYIRFLKSPKLESTGARSYVRALVTVTTDLGDDFFHADLSLHAILLGQATKSQWKTVLWKPSMRALLIEIREVEPSELTNELTLLVNSRRSIEGDHLTVRCMPEILGARSRVVMPQGLGNVDRTERRFQTSLGRLDILEDAGESIARHIW